MFNIPENILEKIPFWIFLVGIGLTGTALASAFTFSFFTGESFYMFGSESGFKREKDISGNSVNILPPENIVEWNQRKYVVDLAQRVLPDNDKAIKIIHECFPRFNSDESVKKKVITKTEAKELIKIENQEKLMAIVGLINYFEGMSIAYNNGVADKKMFEKSFKKLIGRWYGRLEGFIQVYKKICECDWKPFEELGENWKNPLIIPIESDIKLKNCFQKDASAS